MIPFKPFLYSVRKKLRASGFLLALVAWGLFIYANSLRGQFVMDDAKYIINNPAIRQLFAWGRLWDACNSRLLVCWTYALNFQLGGWDPWGYHLLNVLFHIVTSLLVFYFVHLVYQTPALSNVEQERKLFVARGATLIFLCHPIQTQAVSYIMQRAASLACIFYLGTVIFYFKSRLSGKAAFLGLAFAAMSAGLLTKESIATVPLVLILSELFLFKRGQKSLWRQIRVPLAFFIGPAALFLILALNRSSSVSQMKYAIGLDKFSWEYLWTEINVLRTYLRLLIIPLRQNAIYDYPIAKGLLTLSTLWSCAVLVGLGIFAIKVYRRVRVLSFAVCWFFITTPVELGSVVLGNRDVIYEHWLYLALVGYAIFLPAALCEILRKRRHRLLVILIIVGGLSLLTIQRNTVWANELALIQDVLSKSPRKAFAHFAAGCIYQERQMGRRALESYTRAVELFKVEDECRQGYCDKYLSRTYNNLGMLSLEQEQTQKARDYFEQALGIWPDNGEAMNNLGILCFWTRDYSRAEALLTRSVRILGQTGYSQYYLGKTFLALGQKDKAASSLLQARDLFTRAGDRVMIEELDTILSKTGVDEKQCPNCPR